MKLTKSATCKKDRWRFDRLVIFEWKSLFSIFTFVLDIKNTRKFHITILVVWSLFSSVVTMMLSIS